MGIFDIYKNKKDEKVAIDNVKNKLKNDKLTN